jgi:AmmeMemoRadiSam system protein B
MFYPAQDNELRRTVAELLGPGGPTRDDAVPKALIVPHAGYVYSGPVAATAYRLLAPARDRIRRVVLMGPAHRVYLEGMALPATTSFATPLGAIPIDLEAVEAVADLPGVCVSDEAHALEHSLEVQLPFLQIVLDAFRLVPIVVGRCDADLVAGVIDRLWGGPETVTVISSDLSHYLPYSEARRVDGETCGQIASKSYRLSGEQACGAYAINGLMRARHCQALAVEALDVRNSGDTAGDRRQVVGYGAFSLH